jgi:Flp pilus assembly pilin Flp
VALERKDLIMGSTDSTARKPKRRLVRDQGSSLVEYALLVSLIALVCIASLVYFQKSTATKLSTASNSIVTAGN